MLQKRTTKVVKCQFRLLLLSLRKPTASVGVLVHTDIWMQYAQVMQAGVRTLVARNMRRARKRLGISQRHLSERADVPVSLVAAVELERKFPDPEKLERVATALGLQPFQLFLDEEDWSVHDRYESVVTLVGELKQRINRELDEALRRYLR